MEAQNLYWHQREKLQREGGLGPLQEQAAEALRTAVIELLQFTPFDADMAFSHLQRIFGRLEEVPIIGGNPRWAGLEKWLNECSRDEFLTSLEVIAQQDSTSYSHERVADSIVSNSDSQFYEELNEIFVHHRFGFEISPEGVINRVGSPALHEALIQPALLKLQDPRFTEAENHFHMALMHYRGEDSRRCIFEAASAIEAVLKALGYKGSRLEELADDFRKRASERGYITGFMTDVVSLMKRLNALRGDRGGHAAEPEEEPVPLSYALLALHLSGALIVFLVDRSVETSKNP